MMMPKCVLNRHIILRNVFGWCCHDVNLIWKVISLLSGQNVVYKCFNFLLPEAAHANWNLKFAKLVIDRFSNSDETPHETCNGHALQSNDKSWIYARICKWRCNRWERDNFLWSSSSLTCSPSDTSKPQDVGRRVFSQQEHLNVCP